MGYRIGIIVPNSNDQRGRVMAKLINAVIPTALCTTINMHSMVGDYWKLKPGTKSVYQQGPRGPENFAKIWTSLIERKNYDAIVSIDVAFSTYVMPPEDAASGKDIDKLSGMLMERDGMPIMLHFDPLHCYGRMYDPEHQAAYSLISNFQIRKLLNRLKDLAPIEKPVAYMLPTSVADLKACERIAARSQLIATDVETSGGYISCVGFACEVDRPVVPVFVIPLYVNLTESNGLYWKDESTTAIACQIIGNILANPVPKAMHNGGYDMAYFFKYGWYVNNYIFDTMHMMHSTWPSIPRSLFMGASMFLSNYRYWKDDAKEVGEDGKVKWQTPVDVDATARYWHYNGLDCANTLELCLAILRLWTGQHNARFPNWAPGYNHAWRTYVRQFSLEFGPCLYMSMTGIRADTNRQIAMTEKLAADAEKALHNLRILVDNPEFNPNSPPQVATLLYDHLDIKPLARKGRVTDKRILQKFADMHPIYNDVITSINKAKEPRNNMSKYGAAGFGGGEGKGFPFYYGDWWLYQLKTTTVTRRLASSGHNFGYGTQVQNVPKPMRVMCVANPGEYLVSSDYSQSDSYFVAFESQDATMIETVLDDRDTHSVHVEFFFGHKYEDVVRGNKNNEDWVVDPVTGVRQIIKKVSHGTNYDMGGETMLLNVRREAAVTLVNAILASPRAKLFMTYMGLDASKGAAFYAGQGAMWSDQLLAKACEFAQKLYYARYPTLAKWKKNGVQEAGASGGVITMFGGSSTVMLCHPTKNPRFVPAAYGQGGTAGNINNAMLRLFFLAEDMWRKGFRMVIQVHDELVCAVPRNDLGLELTAQKIAIMESECQIHGRKFVVPVEAELSLTWTAKHTVVFKGFDKQTPAEYHAAIEAKEQECLASIFPKKGIAHVA